MWEGDLVRMGTDGVYGPRGGVKPVGGNVRQMVFEQVLIQLAAHSFSGHGGAAAAGGGGGVNGGEGLATAWTH